MGITPKPFNVIINICLLVLFVSIYFYDPVDVRYVGRYFAKFAMSFHCLGGFHFNISHFDMFLFQDSFHARRHIIRNNRIVCRILRHQHDNRDGRCRDPRKFGNDHVFGIVQIQNESNNK